jgi:hypothetical protein
MASTPDALLALLQGAGNFDPAKIRGRLLARFGGEEGLADWLFDLAESVDTTAATRAKCADIILDLLKPGAAASVDTNDMDNAELERLAMRLIKANATNP